MNFQFSILCFILLVSTIYSLKAQDMDSIKYKYFVGLESSNYKYLTVGGERRLINHISGGSELRFVFNPSDEVEVLDRFDIFFKGELHSSSLIRRDLLDLVLGYKASFSGSHGPHIKLNRYFSNNFGLFIRTDYYVKWRKSDTLFAREIPKNLLFGFGLVFQQ